MYRQKLKHRASLVICCIFILNLILGSASVYAAGDTIVLNGPDKSRTKTFRAENLFPGDAVYKNYVLNIPHKKNIDVMFKAKVREGYAKLPEVLKLKVEIVGGGTLYDGLMKDTPEPVTYTLPARQQSVTYRLTVYLDTSVGNDYQNQDLMADFEWYYLLEDDSGGGGSSGGGGGSSIGGTGSAATKMLRRAYVIGRPGEVFRPEAPITRAETVTIFARIFADYNEDNLTSTDTIFSDVADTDWFAKYVSRCQNENIIFGYEGKFRPGESITRAEFAVVCVRFFEKRSGSEVTPEDIAFTDFDSSHWAYETIRKAYANKYVSGYPDGTLRADNIITRAEAVTIVNRMLERIPDKEYIDNNLHKLIDFLDVRDNTYWAYYDIFEAANTHYIRFVNGFAKWVD